VSTVQLLLLRCRGSILEGIKRLLTQAGIIRPGGEGSGNLLQMMMAQQMLAQRQQPQDVEVEPLRKKPKKKLKKFLEEEE